MIKIFFTLYIKYISILYIVLKFCRINIEKVNISLSEDVKRLLKLLIAVDYATDR